MSEQPYGSWLSPLTEDLIASGRVSTSGLHAARGQCWWLESRPDLDGRQVLVRSSVIDRGQPTEPLGAHTGVRSRVHEYGGGSFFVDDEVLVYVGQEDQALYFVPVDSCEGVAQPVRLSPEPPRSEEHRYADPRHAKGASVVALREKHRPGGQDDELVVFDLECPGSEPRLLASGRDFYAAPRPSPDGRWIAWICWDLPAMPWDASELWVAELAGGPIAAADGARRLRPDLLVPPELIAGGPDESVGQPTWVSDDELVFVSDRDGFWQPYVWRCTPSAGAAKSPLAERSETPLRLCSARAEFHSPDWVLGQQTIVAIGNRLVACRVRHQGRDAVWAIGLDLPSGPDVPSRRDAPAEPLFELDQPCVTIKALAVAGSEVLVSGSTPTEGAVIGRVAPRGSWRQIAAPSGRPSVMPERAVSVAHPMTFGSPGGVDAHLLWYAPRPSTEASGPERPGAGAGPGLPPVIVQCHSGPTGCAEIGFDPTVQFWTTRGFAFCAVDYRGSSGYGRAFRRMLDGAWGIADAEDCLAAVEFLAAAGLIDPSRALVRGSSAGGFTALRALALGRAFKGALVSFAVTDLVTLAAQTHKFEAGYTETLVGRWPDDADVYRDRSPVGSVGRISGSVLLLQGDRDVVVPSSQAASLAAALRARGLRCEHVVFPGEGHGFKKADTLATAARLELEFAREVLGVVSAPSTDPLLRM